MRIFTKMILKEWFKSLFGAVTVLFLLISTADLINGFLQGKDVPRVLLEYSLKMPDLMGKMFPICCLVATLFSLNKLKSHSELISILAAGFSFYRFYFIIGCCALTVVAFQFLNLGFFEPFANKVKRQEIQKSKKSEGRYLTRSSIDGGRFWYKSQTYFASFTFFDRTTRSLHDLEVYFFSPTHSGVKIVKAHRATFAKNGDWALTDVIERSSLSSFTFPLETSKETAVLRLEEQPEDFGEFEADLTTLNFFKLRNFINRLSKSGINISEYKILLMNKVSLSLICLIFALIPASTIFNPNRRSSSFGKNVVLTLLVTVVFWVLYSSTIALGNSGTLNPWLATGLIPSFFLAYVLGSFFKNRKLSI
ncbi:MAG TPA: LptF/LptG family permease [Bacteriovoracaceae bacterium]|nr:LptF/LptG family permease [Bacteriovoracaceae bacterium]